MNVALAVQNLVTLVDAASGVTRGVRVGSAAGVPAEGVFVLQQEHLRWSYSQEAGLLRELMEYPSLKLIVYSELVRSLRRPLR